MENSIINKISFAAMRSMNSFIYIVAGLNHLFHPEKIAKRISKARFGYLVEEIADPEILVILSGVGLLFGGVFLLIGLKTRLAALGLMVILVPITITVQIGNPDTAGPLFKNIALAGVLLFFAINNVSYYSVENWIEARGFRLKSSFIGRTMTCWLLLLVFAGMFLSLSSFKTFYGSNDSSALQSTVQSKKYAVLITQPNHLKAAVNAAETLLKDKHYNSTFEVMACGKAVEAFLQGHELSDFYKTGLQAGIKFKVCGMSIQQLKINSNELVDALEVVPNGLTYMFDLKLQGYQTVEL